MRVLESAVQTNAAEFRRRYQHNKALAAQLKARQAQARHERPARDLERLAAHKKLLPRQRLELLLDPGTPFLELSTLAANMAYGGESPGASCITGIGVVAGREVMVHADDPSVKGGAWYPLTVKKIVRALDVAIENHLPVVHLCDSAGGQLQLQSALFPDRYMAGRIFRNQSVLSKMGVKQLALVFGHCTAGGAYIPALSDYNVIVRGTGAVFLGGPPLVKAATGAVVSADELGGCELHTRTSGTCDYPAVDEPDAIAIGREVVGLWERAPKWRHPEQPAEEPRLDADDLYGVIPDDIKQTFDMHEVIGRIVDGSRFHEYKPAYGTTLVCGFAHLFGYRLAILANNGILFNDSAIKGGHFIELCNQNDTPLLFLQNITGYMVGREYEAAGITKDGAKMIMAQACSHVPKLTLMCHGSFGAGNYGMCGRAFDGRLLFSWPNHQIAVMGGEQAAATLAEVKLRQLQRTGAEVDPEALGALRAATLKAYEAQTSAYYSTSELWDDGILDPVDTRTALGIALSAALNAPPAVRGNGVFRF
ncbi:MAG TPA: carboxyl transferase domain-containing protein [Steroidobacteraceae bacterium]|nr:carboxyl transferase domain-containing protein [Steroidobacteraceae bacterium]